MPLLLRTPAVSMRGGSRKNQVAPTFEEASHTLMAKENRGGTRPIKHRKRMPRTGDHSGVSSPMTGGRRTAGSGGIGAPVLLAVRGRRQKTSRMARVTGDGIVQSRNDAEVSDRHPEKMNIVVTVRRCLSR